MVREIGRCKTDHYPVKISKLKVGLRSEEALYMLLITVFSERKIDAQKHSVCVLKDDSNGN